MCRVSRGACILRLPVLVGLALLVACAAAADEIEAPRFITHPGQLGRGGGDRLPTDGTARRRKTFRAAQRAHRKALSRHRQEQRAGAAAVRRRCLPRRRRRRQGGRRDLGQIFRRFPSDQVLSARPGRLHRDLHSQHKARRARTSAIDKADRYSRSPARPSSTISTAPITSGRISAAEGTAKTISRHQAHLARGACALRVRALRRALRRLHPVLRPAPVVDAICPARRPIRSRCNFCACCAPPAARRRRSQQPHIDLSRPQAKSDFTYYSPGDLIPNTGWHKMPGRADYHVYARMRFPIADAPAYVKSQSFMPWGDCYRTGRSGRSARRARTTAARSTACRWCSTNRRR